MCDVAFFSLAPWRFGSLVGVRAACDDACDGLAETFSDVAQTFCASAIFNHIVEKGGNGFCFVRAILKRDGSDGKHMRDVGNAAAFPRLIAVRLCGVEQCLLKLRRELHGSPF